MKFSIITEVIKRCFFYENVSPFKQAIENERLKNKTKERKTGKVKLSSTTSYNILTDRESLISLNTFS